MSRLIERVSAFQRQAASGPVKINVHGANAARSQRIDRMVIFACLIAGGLGAGTAQWNEAQSPHYQGRSTHGPIIDQRSPGSPSDLDQRMIRSEDAPRLNYVQVTFAGRQVLTLDEASRIALAKDAARKQQLQSVGLTWKDLYGVIHAETAWVARDGIGKNGVTSSGLAQLEPATARGLNVTDPNDPVEAVHASANLMRQAALWARSKLRGMKLSTQEQAIKIREGVSIYYNLSTRGRSQWNGLNAEEMPVETQRHIRNSRDGAMIAGHIEKRLLRSAERSQKSDIQRAGYHPETPSANTRLAQMIRQERALHVAEQPYPNTGYVREKHR